jgi:ABC-type sugar transport system ATPase subunit
VAALLAAHEISKHFGATRALHGVSFALEAGEVHALVGENGAGKSTLIKLFGGVHRPDAGQIRVDGEAVRFHSPVDAFRAGIAVIQQELRVVPALSVAENVMLGHLPSRGLLVDQNLLKQRAGEALARLHVELDLDAPVGRLAFAERQAVAIARALSREARALILDEPTAPLEEREVESLFEVIARLKLQGVAILYVSHRLEEIPRIADRCTVMRDGRIVAKLQRGELAVSDLVWHMVGHEVDDRVETRQRTNGKVLLDKGGLRLESGSITGLAGLLGSGTGALLRRLFTPPPRAVRSGIGLVPNDRAASLVPGQSVRDNIVLPSLRRFGSFARMDDGAVDAVVRELIAALDIRPADPYAPVRALSGGNQQKVVLAKWLAARVSVLLMDEPTQGIDVAVKVQIHRLMREFAARGGAVLFASSEVRELMLLADRVVAMRRGAVSATLERDELDKRAVREAIS